MYRLSWIWRFAIFAALVFLSLISLSTTHQIKDLENRLKQVEQKVDALQYELDMVKLHGETPEEAKKHGGFM